MNGKLFAQAITKVISGLLLVGFLLFLPAGSFLYWNGWLLIAVLFVPMSELISLDLADLNLKMGYIICHDEEKTGAVTKAPKC